jgi:hypothetical protein
MGNWNIGVTKQLNNKNFYHQSIILLGTAGGTTGGRTGPTGRAGSAFELSATRKRKGRHYPAYFFTLAFRT